MTSKAVSLKHICGQSVYVQRDLPLLLLQIEIVRTLSLHVLESLLLQMSVFFYRNLGHAL